MDMRRGGGRGVLNGEENWKLTIHSRVFGFRDKKTERNKKEKMYLIFFFMKRSQKSTIARFTNSL